MKKQIGLEHCKCDKNKMFEASEAIGILHGHVIGCYNLDCDIGYVTGIGLTQKFARKNAIKKWNKIMSKM